MSRKILGVIANALNVLRGDYVRKNETLGNWRGLFTSSGARYLIRYTTKNLTKSYIILFMNINLFERH